MTARACPGSGLQVPLTWEEAKDRTIDVACTVCGQVLPMRAVVGGSAAKKLNSAAAAKTPPHDRRREGQAP